MNYRLYNLICNLKSVPRDTIMPMDFETREYIWKELERLHNALNTIRSEATHGLGPPA